MFMFWKLIWEKMRNFLEIRNPKTKCEYFVKTNKGEKVFLRN